MNADRNTHWAHTSLSWNRRPKHALQKLLPALLCLAMLVLSPCPAWASTAQPPVTAVVPQRLAQNDFTGQAGAWGDLTVALAFSGGSENPLTADLSLGGYQKPVVLPNTSTASSAVLPAAELNRLAPGTYDLLLSWSETEFYEPCHPTVIGTVTVVAPAPQTWDSASLGLWWLALCASACLCAALLLRARRRKSA